MYSYPDSNGGDRPEDSYVIPVLSPLSLPPPFTRGVMDECVVEDTMAAHITTSLHRRECEQMRHWPDPFRHDRTLIDRFQSV
ncbi:uncharacterized [Tachysurus ichikawai]